MVSFQSGSIEVMALQIASQWQSPFKDGLVMRLGEGWEASNAEAIAAWLQSFELTGECKPVDVEHVREYMATLLRTQSEQLWERGSCPFPQPRPFLPQIALSLPLCQTMAHALIEMLATWQPIDVVVTHCAAVLPGKGNGVQKLSQWLYAQQACFTYHPSELTEPLGHELIRVLYPAFKAGY